MRTFTRREISYGLIFALSLAWGGWNYRHLFTGKSTTGDLSSAAAPVAAQTPAQVAKPTEVPQEPGEESWGTDPFNRDWRSARTAIVQPGVVVRKAPLKLSAIVVRPPKRYAIINGLIVREGDEVAGRRVTRIESAQVLLDDQGVEVTLTL